MADPSTAAVGPSDGAGAAAGTTFQLEFNALAGGCLAVIPEAQAGWQLEDVLSRLPEVPPGRRYQLLRGEAVLAPGTAIAEWARPVGGRACVTAVVAAPPTREEQLELDKALVKAAGALDVERVCGLLTEGASARYGPVPTNMTALHAALESRGPRARRDREGGDGDREEEGRLQAAVSALLSARADPDARLMKSGLGGFVSTCALHLAVRYGSLRLVRVLLEARASVDAVAEHRNRGVPGYDEQDSECTALHAATQAGRRAACPSAALLLERGADANAVKRYLGTDESRGSEPCHILGPRPQAVKVRETTLHIAAAGGHQALVALLVQAGADASIARSRNSEELCAANPGMLDALKTGSSAAILAGGAFGAEVGAALAAVAARRAVAAALAAVAARRVAARRRSREAS